MALQPHSDFFACQKRSETGGWGDPLQPSGNEGILAGSFTGSPTVLCAVNVVTGRGGVINSAVRIDVEDGSGSVG